MYFCFISDAYNGRGKNADVPFLNGNEDKFLKSKDLQMQGKFYRFGRDYAPPGIDLAYKGDLHYPAVYNGSFSFENPQANLVQRRPK